MKKYFWRVLLPVLGLMFFLTADADAATFSLVPSTRNLITGCSASIDVIINLEAGEQSNAAQIYIDHNAIAGEVVSISGAGLYASYGTPSGMPAGRIGIYGYGGTISGTGRKFATIILRSNNIGRTLNLDVHFDTAQSVTSKIADLESNNILTAVSGGTYTVVTGYCETAPPYLSAMDPAEDKPNHPVGNDIKFDIKDDSSGVDISTLAVTVIQNGETLPTAITTEKRNPGDDKWYSVSINPDADLTPELRVDVTVQARDKAGNQMNRAYSFNDLTCAQLGCVAGGAVAQCQDGEDNDGDGDSDYPADSGCDSADDNNELPGLSVPSSGGGATPQCQDGVDNDGDGFIDHPADSGCDSADDNNEYISGDCSASGSGATCNTQCNDGVDNDGDGMIDLADDGCGDTTDNNEYIYIQVECPVCGGAGTATTEQAFDLSGAKFFLANRTIEVRPDSAGTVYALPGTTFTAAVDVNGLTGQVDDARLRLGPNEYEMFYDNSLHLYAIDVTAPFTPGSFGGFITVSHGDQETLTFRLTVLPKGTVMGETDDVGKPIVGSAVSLEQRGASGKYVAVRSTVTDARGEYGFVVPNGTYRLMVSSAGYRDYVTAGFAVNNNVVNNSFRLIKSVDLLDGDVSLLDKAEYVASVAQTEVVKAAKQADNPAVEAVAKNVAAPIAAAAAIAAVAPALSLINLLTYLRFLFLQPVLLLGRRRRKEFGVVYNTLTKMPLDLVTVRLIDATSGKVVRSRVTDAQGRYSFFVDPGLYRIEVTKQGFIFPSKLLQGVQTDTDFVDIYHGEPIHVDNQAAAIAANIPLDPVGAPDRTPRRLKINKFLRKSQTFIANVGAFTGLLAFIITPSYLTGSLLAAQFIVYLLFKRLSADSKPSGWGIVYARDTQKPLDKAVVRLFSKQFNKLVATEVTDGKGRYSFIVGPNTYYVTFEKAGYMRQQTSDITVKEKTKTIKENAKLEKDISGAEVINSKSS